MNAKNILFAAALSAGLFCSAASAAVVIPASEVLAEGAKLPMPTKVVRFNNLPQYLCDKTVHVSMVIDENGTPSGIEGWKGASGDVLQRISPVVSQWRFSPAQDKDGKPISMRVIIPLKLVAAR